MKKTFNLIKNFVIIIYIALIIFVTICLLSYNDYGVTVFDDNTLLPVIDDNLEPKFSLGELLVIKKGKLNDINPGDEIFFYKTIAGEVTTTFAKVVDVEAVTPSEYTFTVENDFKFSSSNLIGKVETTKIIPKLGRFLSILQSKWGFLFLGVFPSLIAFLYTLYTVVLEIQVPEEDEPKKKKNKKSSSKNPKIQNNDDISKNNVDDKKEEKNVESNISSAKEQFSEDNEIDKVNNIDTVPKETIEHRVEEKSNVQQSENIKEKSPEEKKKELIEEKMKSMTDEEKKALIKAKLDAMTPEQKKAFIEARKNKMNSEKK